MTALVAVMNKQAVALAADSTATTSGRVGQPPKIYNTNKLFTLSKHHPVGIMVYSSAEVMTLPVETVIKVYRERLEQERGGKPFPRLHDYHEDFVAFLQTNTEVFPDRARLENAKTIVAGVLLRLANKVIKRIDASLPSGAALGPVETAETIRTILSRDHSAFRSAPKIGSGLEKARLRLRAELKDVASGFGKRVLDQFGYSLSAREARMVLDICVDALTRDFPALHFTGFVIAGFGEDEYVPHLQSFQFSSSVMGFHKLRALPEVNADEGSGGGAILPFAQTEMMETFVEGRARAFDERIRQSVHNFFDKWKVDMSAQAADDLQTHDSIEALAGLRDGLVDSIRIEINGFAKREHIDPILSNVSNMPKEELAVMAEALVSLTAMKRHVASAAETVGGPTDVAVISKGDGFIWIKRKHYFKPELNPEFALNYYRNGTRQ